jgi:hypothetical protein
LEKLNKIRDLIRQKEQDHESKMNDLLSYQTQLGNIFEKYQPNSVSSDHVELLNDLLAFYQTRIKDQSTESELTAKLTQANKNANEWQSKAKIAETDSANTRIQLKTVKEERDRLKPYQVQSSKYKAQSNKYKADWEAQKTERKRDHSEIETVLNQIASKIGLATQSGWNINKLQTFQHDMDVQVQQMQKDHRSLQEFKNKLLTTPEFQALQTVEQIVNQYRQLHARYEQENAQLAKSKTRQSTLALKLQNTTSERDAIRAELTRQKATFASQKTTLQATRATDVKAEEKKTKKEKERADAYQKAAQKWEEELTTRNILLATDLNGIDDGGLRMAKMMQKVKTQLQHRAQALSASEQTVKDTTARLQQKSQKLNLENILGQIDLFLQTLEQCIRFEPTNGFLEPLNGYFEWFAAADTNLLKTKFSYGGININLKNLIDIILMIPTIDTEKKEMFSVKFHELSSLLILIHLHMGRINHAVAAFKLENHTEAIKAHSQLKEKHEQYERNRTLIRYLLQLESVNKLYSKMIEAQKGALSRLAGSLGSGLANTIGSVLFNFL